MPHYRRPHHLHILAAMFTLFFIQSTYLRLHVTRREHKTGFSHNEFQYLHIPPSPSPLSFPMAMKSIIIARNTRDSQLKSQKVNVYLPETNSNLDKLHIKHEASNTDELFNAGSKFISPSNRKRNQNLFLHSTSLYIQRENHSPQIEVKPNALLYEKQISNNMQLSESIGNIHITSDDKNNSEDALLRLRPALDELLSRLSIPTYHCLKMLRLGGYHCKHMPDGEKSVCHDPGLAPDPDYCLVYSLGVGHDLSFDLHIDKYGCEVYAFDSDAEHDHYPTFITDRLSFYKVRIGTEFLQETQFKAHDLGAGPHIVNYWPLEAVMARLRHSYSLLHYLKLDVEGAEWAIMEQLINETDILNRTQQVGLEVHLEGLRHKEGSRDTSHLLNIVNSYLRVIQGLQDRGFHLAHWEPNYLKPELTSAAGLTFHVFFETLWVNHGAKARKNLPPRISRPQSLK